MVDKPLIEDEERPDLTIDMEAKVGELTIRDLATLLSTEFDVLKEGKSEQKEQKDKKDGKDHKDSKDQKDQKDHKDQKDQKDQKDHKDHKDQKDHKDHKDLKDAKEQKELKEMVLEAKAGVKELIKEVVAEGKLLDPKRTDAVQPPVENQSDLDTLIKRLSDLEQSVEELKERK
jgi:hypothetical protein